MLSYASYFTAYILNNITNYENIERIIFFGSAARNEADKESDIDLFIEVKKRNQKIEKEIQKITENFYDSREAALFKNKGIENLFDIKIGLLKEWKDLYRSIVSTGIILYGKYEAKELPSEVNHNIIIFWDKIAKNRGSFLNKLYGVKVNDKYYQGLLQKFRGKKIGKSSIMFPIEYKQNIFKLLKEHKVHAKIIEVFI